MRRRVPLVLCPVCTLLALHPGAPADGERRDQPTIWPCSPGITISTAASIQNAVYYTGSGPTLFLGTLIDIQSFWNGGLGQTVSRGIHVGNGMAGGARGTRRWAAMIYGANGGNASDPKVDRVKADATGCDAASAAAPCFDIGNTYAASLASGAATVTITGGLAAHARPFVVGQAFILRWLYCRARHHVSCPLPRRNRRSRRWTDWKHFHLTAGGRQGFGVSGTTETVTAGCSGTSGTGFELH